MEVGGRYATSAIVVPLQYLPHAPLSVAAERPLNSLHLRSVVPLPSRVMTAVACTVVLTLLSLSLLPVFGGHLGTARGPRLTRSSPRLISSLLPPPPPLIGFTGRLVLCASMLDSHMADTLSTSDPTSPSNRSQSMSPSERASRDSLTWSSSSFLMSSVTSSNARVSQWRGRG